MPYKAKRPCAYVGCTAYSSHTSQYCDTHRKQYIKQTDARRGSYRDRGYTSAWDKYKHIYMATHPLCIRCERKGYLVAAELVHHKTRLVDGGALMDDDNLEALCRKCHDEVHKHDKWGSKK